MMARSTPLAGLIGGTLAALALATPAQALPVSYATPLAPANGSGVTGTATLTLDGTLLTYSVQASGLVPGVNHLEHIHGFVPYQPSTIPTPATNDLNHDGIIAAPEGELSIGPEIFGLTATPNAPATVPSSYPVASAGGLLSFSQTYELAADVNDYQNGATLADLLHLDGRGLELHGGLTPVASPAFGPAGTYVPDLPVASGLLRAVPEPGSLAIFTLGLVGCWIGAQRRHREPADT